MNPLRIPRGFLQWGTLFIVMVLAHWSVRFQPFWWDSLGYVFAHALEIHDANLFPILRRWDVGHPTAYYFLLAGMMKVFGVGPLAGHLLGWGFAALLAWSTFVLGRLLGANRLAAAACTAAVMTFPLVWAATRQITADLALTALVTASLWSWSSRRRRLYLGFGSLAVLTKFTGFLILPALAVAALMTPIPEGGNRRRELGWALGPLVALVVFLAVRWAVRGPSWTIGWVPMQELAPVWAWTSFRENWPDASRQLWGLSRISWPMTAAALALVALAAGRLRHSSRLDLSAASRALIAVSLFGCLYTAAMVQLTSLLPRFGLPLAVVAFLLLTWALTRFPGKGTTAAIICGLIALLNIAQWHPLWCEKLPVPLREWIRPEKTIRGHNLEIDLRYEDAIALVQWSAQEIRRDAALGREGELPGITTQWPLTAALADPRLGYVDKGFPTVSLTSWASTIPPSHPYVLTITGVTYLPPEPVDSPHRVRPVASKSQGAFTAYIWQVSRDDPD